MRDRLLLVVVGLAALLPAFLGESAFTGDAQVHWKWQAQFARHFWTGDLLPRWLIDLNEGFGSPAFFYYPPLAQWLASLWAPLLPAPSDIPARFALTLALLSVVGAFGARAWIAGLTGDRLTGLAGAVLYTLLPYHAYVNIFQRGAFAELAAMAWLPWVFHGLTRAVRGERLSFIFIGSLTLLYISHAPSILMILPALAAVALYEAGSARSWRGLLACAASGLVATLLAGFYLAPAFMLTGALNSVRLFGPYFDPTRWLILGPAWPNPGTSLYTHALFALYALAGLGAGVLLRLGPGSPMRATASKALGGFAVVMALMTAAATPFWEHAAILRKIQFPWRLMTLATLWLSLAGAVAIMLLVRHGRLWRLSMPAAIAVVAAGLLAINGAFLGARLMKAAHEGKAAPGVAETLANRRDQNEYQLGDLNAAGRVFGTARAIGVPAGPPVRIESWEPRRVTLATAFDRPTMLLVRQFRYTGWTALIDGGLAVPAGNDPAALGVVAAAVPRGRHEIVLVLPPSPWERVGWYLSLAGMLLLAIVLLLRRSRARAAAAPPFIDRERPDIHIDGTSRRPVPSRQEP